MRSFRLIIPFVAPFLLILFSTVLVRALHNGEFTDSGTTVVEPVTIPLWGPTWAKSEVTVSVDAGRGVSDAAVHQVRRAIADWQHAIDSRTGRFAFTEVVGDADVVVKVKKGGGMVQGQALCKSDGGFFIDCKVNVSGKAFGSDNPDDTVLSIAIQELGHSLGLLHADNPDDVMYGTLRNPPNTLISECDLDAWEAVMDWLLMPVTEPDPASAYPPVVDSVSCGVVGEDPAPPSYSGILDVLVWTDQDQDPYINREFVLISVSVFQDGDPVEDAAVHVTLVTAKGNTLVGDNTTNSEGIAGFRYRVNAGRNGLGTYHVLAEAEKDLASGECLETDACHTDFIVE